MKAEAGLFQGFVLALALHIPFTNGAFAVFGFRVAVFVFTACPYAIEEGASCYLQGYSATHCCYPTGLETKDKPASYCCS
jgi:hypothetical protein